MGVSWNLVKSPFAVVYEATRIRLPADFRTLPLSQCWVMLRDDEQAGEASDQVKYVVYRFRNVIWGSVCRSASAPSQSGDT